MGCRKSMRSLTSCPVNEDLRFVASLSFKELPRWPPSFLPLEVSLISLAGSSTLPSGSLWVGTVSCAQQHVDGTGT